MLLQVLKVNQEQPERLVPRVLEVIQGHLGHRDHRVPLVIWGQQVLQDLEVHQDYEVIQVRKDVKGDKVNTSSSVLMRVEVCSLVPF